MEKLYFRDEDSNHCYSLEEHLREAKQDDLKDVELIEAIPDDGTSDYIWCHVLDAVEKSQCSKKCCSYYESKSGRGRCDNKGSLYLHGEKKTFKVE